MDGIHAFNGTVPKILVPPRFHELRNQHAGVVVTLLATLCKLSCTVKQTLYRTTAEGVEQSQFQRAGDVKGEFIASQQVDNALTVSLGIELTDFLPNLRRMKNFPGATVNRAGGNLGRGNRLMEGAARCSHANFMSIKVFIIISECFNTTQR
jgi:hypothetical protein